jgi:uncharacterized repeat protein (TIGR04076 family)
MFKVKATLVRFAGDVEKYPCHFGYEVGDEIVYDGESFTGRICLQILPLLDKYVPPLFSAGPRYVNPFSYFPFFYSPPNTRDTGAKNSDGVGFKIVRENIVEPKYHMANFRSPNAFKWPPHDKRDVAKEIVGRCDDLRTAATFRFETFDLADRGDAIPYFRKQMVILDEILRKPGIVTDRIMSELPKRHVDEIYPGLNPVLLVVLLEELEVIGFVEIRDSKVTATEKGEARLNAFRAALSKEEKEALQI